ncbi:MAG TPA: hypothetical protein VGM77_14165 [Gemmatimonadales bacterium]
MTLPQIIETTFFAKQADALLTADEQFDLSTRLMANPMAGVVEPGTGGLRKLRLGFGGRGKRGGARVVYFHASRAGEVLLLALFAKNEQSMLTVDQKHALRQIVEAEYGKHR